MHSTRSFLSPSLFSFLADEHKSLVSRHIRKPMCCPLATKGFERRYSWAHTDLVLSDEQLGQTGIQAWSSNMDECVYPPTAVLCLSRRGWGAGPRFGDTEVDRVASSLAWCLRVVHECLRDTGVRIRPPVPPMVRAFVYYGPQFVCDSQTEHSGSVLRFSKPRLETDAGAVLESSYTDNVEIVAHEFFHGTSRLEYAGLSGAIDEASADIFGVLVRMYRHWASNAEGAPVAGLPQGWWRGPEWWVVGMGIMDPFLRSDILVTSSAMRCLAPNPPDGVLLMEQVATHMADVAPYDSPSRNNDWGNVHTNMGIASRAFYHLAMSFSDSQPPWTTAASLWFGALRFLGDSTVIHPAEGGHPESANPDCDNPTFGRLEWAMIHVANDNTDSLREAVSELWGEFKESLCYMWELHLVVSQLVLATDMSRHLEITSQFSTHVTTGKVDGANKADRLVVLQMMIKAADCVMSKFFGQGDREREEGLTVSPFMDRQTADTANCQLAFIKFIVRPMSELVHHINPDVSRAMLAKLEANSVKWGGSSLSSSNRSRK
eukprot:m51a1_g4832 putative high affinity camp-specific 3 -cyclic phosphodiesterase 7a isoform x3 (546) ;mRNA; f:193119-195165